MTKARDRYQSQFGAGVPGVRSAIYDVGMALYLLESLAREHNLLDASVSFSPDEQGWPVKRLLVLAHDALNTSIGRVLWIYERLQQNEEAAFLMSETLDDPAWLDKSEALTQTLNNKQVISRGFVSEARRVLARRDKGITKEAASKKRGGDAL